MPWQLLTAISVVTLSISVLLQRVLLHKDKSDPIAYVIFFNSLVALFTAIYAISNGFVMPDFGKYWPIMLLSAILFGVGHIFYAKTLQVVEASIFSVLFATNAVWTMILSLFVFNEHIGGLQLVGVLLIFASVALIAERSGKFKVDRGVLLGLITGVLFGFATVCWVYVGKYSDAASWNAISFAGTVLVVLAISPKSIKQLKYFINREKLTKISLLGVLFSISAITILLAFQKGNVSLIAPLQQTTIIVTTALAVIFLKERKHLWRKGLAAAVCFVGVLMIV